MRLSERAFRTLVDEALALVPEEFLPYLKDVPVAIEGAPSDELLDEMGIPEDETLYGLYTGRPLSEGPPEPGELPPRIIIYRTPLLEDCVDVADLREEIITTILHEVAHHFGLDEERLTELGWD